MLLVFLPLCHGYQCRVLDKPVLPVSYTLHLPIAYHVTYRDYLTIYVTYVTYVTLTLSLCIICIQATVNLLCNHVNYVDLYCMSPGGLIRS